MKIKPLMLPLFVSIFLCLCAFARAETTTTVMLYMCGTDLQEDCVQDLYEMCSVSLPESVKVVVQAGGASEWADSDLAPNAINRFLIEDHTFADLEYLPGESMGDGDTLQSFLEWAVPGYPADRYILILWDHGGGSDQGMCFDETADGDGMTIHEIYSALYNVRQANEDFHLDILGCDACLMATYEMAAHMADYADFLVASEELEPWLGWNYAGWMSALAENPDMDSQGIAVAIADAYMEACLEDNPDSYYSQSVIYLPAMYKLVQYTEQYAAYLNEALQNGQMAAISRARQRMYAFGDYSASDEANCMVDFMAFLDGTRQFAPNTADLVETAYQRAVRYNVGTDTFDYLTGLSIYLPYGDTAWLLENFDDYGCEETLPNYSDFVYAYASMLAGSDYAFAARAPSQADSALSGGSFFSGNMTGTVFAPGGTYTAAGDADAAYQDPEDVAAGLPAVESSVSALAGVTVGGILPAAPEQAPAGETADAVYACSMTLSADELKNLSLVEGMLFMDGSDEEDTFYIEMGAMQNAYVDWETGEIASGFDGAWPMLGEQIVALYDQIVTANMRRSFINVKCNGVDGFLLMNFNAAHPEGVIAGFTRGFDDRGLPVRGATQLQPGDVIIPTYNMLYLDEQDEFQEETFDGDPITVGDDGAISFAFLPLEGGEMNYLYCFRLTDIFGETHLSDFISFML